MVSSVGGIWVSESQVRSWWKKRRKKERSELWLGCDGVSRCVSTLIKGSDNRQNTACITANNDQTENRLHRDEQ